MKRTLVISIFFTSLILLLVVGCSNTTDNTAKTKIDTSLKEGTQVDKGIKTIPGEFVTKQFFITGFT